MGPNPTPAALTAQRDRVPPAGCQVQRQEEQADGDDAEGGDARYASKSNERGYCERDGSKDSKHARETALAIVVQTGACSSARSERLPDKQEVAGSIPTRPTAV